LDCGGRDTAFERQTPREMFPLPLIINLPIESGVALPFSLRYDAASRLPPHSMMLARIP